MRARVSQEWLLRNQEMRRRRTAEVARRSHQIRPESCRKRQKVGGNKGPQGDDARGCFPKKWNGFLIYEQFFSTQSFCAKIANNGKFSS
jgi:hypothetical protein